MDWENDVESILRKDQQEKKAAGRGIFKRKATRRGHISVRTEYDLLSSQEKRKYSNSGVCIIYSKGRMKFIIEEAKNGRIISLDEIRALELRREAQEIISYIRGKHKNDEIAKQWGVPLSRVTAICYKEYGVQKTRTGVVTITDPDLNLPALARGKYEGDLIRKAGTSLGEDLKNSILGLEAFITPEKRYKFTITIEEVGGL